MGKEAFGNVNGSSRYERIAERLTHIVGQGDAVNTIKAALDGSSAPTLIFTGPDGVGKTETAKEIAEGSGTGFIRLDMCDFSLAEDHYRLIGSPRGEGSVGAWMSALDKIRARPRSVLLLDEIEKAHPKTLSIVNDILLARSTTLNDGHDLDFENATVIITTRLDRDALKKQLAEAGLFSRKLPEGQTIEDALDAALPEKTTIFQPISEDAVKGYIKQRVSELSGHMQARTGKTIEITQAAVDDIVTRLEPEVAKVGLRAVRALIEQEVVPPVAKMILRNDLPSIATIGMRDGSLAVYAKSTASPGATGPAVNPQ